MVEGADIISFGRPETSEARLGGYVSQNAIHGVLVGLGCVCDGRGDRVLVFGIWYYNGEGITEMKIFPDQTTTHQSNMLVNSRLPKLLRGTLTADNRYVDLKLMNGIYTLCLSS